VCCFPREPGPPCARPTFAERFDEELITGAIVHATIRTRSSVLNSSKLSEDWNLAGSHYPGPRLGKSGARESRFG